MNSMPEETFCFEYGSVTIEGDKATLLTQDDKDVCYSLREDVAPNAPNQEFADLVYDLFNWLLLIFPPDGDPLDFTRSL